MTRVWAIMQKSEMNGNPYIYNMEEFSENPKSTLMIFDSRKEASKEAKDYNDGISDEERVIVVELIPKIKEA